MRKYEQLYNYELEKLKKFCSEAEIIVDIIETGVEYRVLLSGNGQMDIFGDCEQSHILIETALKTKVKMSGKLEIDPAQLKKTIKLVEKAAAAYIMSPPARSSSKKAKKEARHETSIRHSRVS